MPHPPPKLPIDTPDCTLMFPQRMNSLDDIIAAIVTAPGEAGVAIVRLSGGGAIELADSLFRPSTQRRLINSPGGRFLHGSVINREGREIDEVLALVMRAPHSYTGEDTVEFQGHGGHQSARRILHRCLEAGCRSAGPGEYTQRAFLNGKIDLLQAEAVLDLIKARSERAASAAIEQLEGGLSCSIGEVYEYIITLAADVEATLDFVEEELPETVMDQLHQRSTQAHEQLRQLLSTWEEGQLLREGALVVIAGKPNAGKSTLLNRLLQRDRAIVSDTPGTTRDSIEETLILSGIPVRLVDTAGLRESEDHIEMAGVGRTKTLLEDADLVLYLIDSEELVSFTHCPFLESIRSGKVLVLGSKSDQVLPKNRRAPDELTPLYLSNQTGEGIQELQQILVQRLSHDADLEARPHAVISERHRQFLEISEQELRLAIQQIEQGLEESVVPAVSHLRAALDPLSTLTGKEYTESLLDNIFSRFCVGK